MSGDWWEQMQPLRKVEASLVRGDTVWRWFEAAPIRVLISVTTGQTSGKTSRCFWWVYFAYFACVLQLFNKAIKLNIILGSCSRVALRWTGSFLQHQQQCRQSYFVAEEAEPGRTRSYELLCVPTLIDELWVVLKEWDCRYKRLKWVSSAGRLDSASKTGEGDQTSG